MKKGNVGVGGGGGGGQGEHVSVLGGLYVVFNKFLSPTLSRTLLRLSLSLSLFSLRTRVARSAGR
jgi:hypothetical protein